MKQIPFLTRLAKGGKVVIQISVIIVLFIFASEGPNGGGTFTSDAGNGGEWMWNSPSNAGASDNVYANFNADNSSNSEWLMATNFGFSSVSGTVNGIVVEIEQRGVTGSVFEQDIRLVKGGTVQGDDKSTGANLPVTDTYVSYGSSSDLWGLSWNAGDITASTFGVVFSVAFSTPTLTRVDHIRITVYYTLATPPTKRRVFGEIRDMNGNGEVELVDEYDYRVSAKGGWKFAH
ncbi:MAG: hypothetical protein EPO24_13190 [Bacteroidetes bacterium]|nr:MAG: hypothetical protein EPO24_13190 [Bacteroidota bacterium]